MKQISLLMILSFVCFSCNSLTKEKELSNLLSGKDFQYWDYEWSRENADQHGFTFKFEKNGNLTKYSYNKSKNERRLFSDYPSPEIDNIWKWKVYNDSTLILLGDTLNIIRYTKDTIIFNDESLKNEMLIRVKHNLNIVK